MNDTIFITTNTTWNSPKYLHNHVKIINNATLTIQADVTCYTSVSITLTNNSKMIIDGTNVKYATLKSSGNSQIDVIHNGAIQYRQSQSIPLGCIFNLIYGKIEKI